MRFIIVNPKTRTITPLGCESVSEAQQKAGLDLCDHGIAAKGLGYFVDEHGLYVPASEQHYFSIGHTLFAGTAVFYGFGVMGETIDLRLSEFPEVRWYLGINDVEAAIDSGAIIRPYMAVNGEVIWAWAAT